MPQLLTNDQRIRYALVNDHAGSYYKARVNYVPDDWSFVELDLAPTSGATPSPSQLRCYPLSSFLWWEIDA